MADFTAKALTLGKFNRAHPSQGQSLNLQTESVRQLCGHLYKSLKLRILDVPLRPEPAAGVRVRVAVLFSGGLDCTVLARIAHDILPSDQQIDLLNVAFENPRVVKAAKKSARARSGEGEIAKKNGDGNSSYHPSAPEDDDSPFESCPDRETGRKAFQELQIICPGRCWRFVAVSFKFYALSSD